ncbi:MAG TPA: hypothetical protein VN764_08885, partial [Polyangiaceae bacterium]|nr:hypothetical protein [Polyangiaceae bacterium]
QKVSDLIEHILMGVRLETLRVVALLQARDEDEGDPPRRVFVVSVCGDIRNGPPGMNRDSPGSGVILWDPG